MRHDDNSNLMYRLLVQGVTDYAIYLLTPDGLVANWNAGAERAKGYRSQDIVGRHFSCFYVESDRDDGLPARSLTRARETGRFQAEGWRVRQDGSQFWAHVVIDAIYDEDGVFIGFAKITRDYTEKRTAAVALQAAKNNLDRALANINNGVCLLDPDERIIACNRLFIEMLSIDPTIDPLGKTLTEVFGEKGADAIRKQQLFPALQSKETFSFEIERRQSRCRNRRGRPRR